MKELINKINKINGIKYVLPFNDILVIDFETVWLPENFVKEKMLASIKKTIHDHGFNMLTTKNSHSKKFIALVPLNLD
ncbi:MAG TPA: hypothetical protein VMX17_02350 [Candidatus Glassbacteria bacterium]|nr:hypothetical protein [Candidatus Glassbacteria bacterium]